MNANVYTPNPDLVRRLCDEGVLGHAPREIPVDSSDVVASIITAVFWASLGREEGRPARFSVALVAPEACTRKFVLAKKEPLNPDSLVKLFAASQFDGNCIGVTPGVDGGLGIWGVTLGMPLRSLVLSAIDPGVVLARLGRRNLAVFSLSAAEFVGGDATRFSQIVAFGFDLRLPFPERFARGEVLRGLATAMRAHGHGGTLLVVSAESDSWRASMQTPLQRELAPPFDVLPDLDALRTEQNRDVTALEVEVSRLAQFRAVIDSIARLTAVDGAVVISEKLQVLGFGAKIVTKDGPGPRTVTRWRPVEGTVPTPVCKFRKF